MGSDGGSWVVSVSWTRQDLMAVREAIEVTPLFPGRSEARDVVRAALQTRRIETVALDADIAGQLAGRIVPTDQATAIARAKLLQAVKAAPAP